MTYDPTTADWYDRLSPGQLMALADAAAIVNAAPGSIADDGYDRAGHPLPCSCNAGHDLHWED